ncbi:sensor histidine kinase [Streptomyces zingiberis]|uniref:histidine kinase n=1 Tax=Streptomyces zingiberis TaxID=2053010 RepID=A0ABX1C1L0_9ACTN|nr:ATP-binding protein [Streptomyces zingiberis]NJQ02666.1 sensor histidine kinase [Streptomyces zingiberis]
MVRAGTSPARGRPASAPMWLFLLVPPAVTSLCAVAAVLASPATARTPVAWCGAAAVAAVAVTAAAAVRRAPRTGEAVRRSAEREAALCRRLAEQETETARLAADLLPAAVERLQQGAGVEEVLDRVEHTPGTDPGLRDIHQAVLRSVLEAVRAEEDLRESAHRAFVNIARRVQAIVHRQALDLREMEDRHGNDPEVFGDLLRLDHGNALVGRLADSIAVLGGSHPGRQWRQPVPLYNVLRGAMSRIRDYQRVDLHSVAEVGVVGPAVEPLIHALAELLDNATRYSPPQTRVHLTATEVQTGVAVEIEDAGIGLSDEARRRVEDTLARGHAGGIDLDDLGETPRLGLAVVARLARSNRFRVALRSSAYGGVRCVLVVPREHLTATPAPGGAVARAAVLPPRRLRTRPVPTQPQDEDTGRGGATGPEVARAAGHPGSGRTGPGGERGPGGPGVPGGGTPAVAGRSPGALPQRRRRAPAFRARPAAGAPGPARTAGTAPGPAGAPPATPAEQVAPGLRLAAFHSGINGETPAPRAGEPAPGRKGTAP